MKANLLQRCWVTFSVYVVGFYASFLNRFVIKGSDHIPHCGPVLIASNHISAYDTIFLPWAVIRHNPLQMLWAPAKEELFENTFLRMIYTSWGAFPVKRKRDVRAGRFLNDLLLDQKVMLFPEGTRHKDGKLGPGNRGVGKIIYDTRPAVIPTALIGLNLWKFPGFRQDAQVVFGAALDFSDLFQLEDCKETHLLIVDRVMQAIAALLTGKGLIVAESDEQIVEIFCDGACSGNPGPGGYGTILRYGGRIKELSGGARDTTNNRMEMTAAIEGLRQLTRPCRVLITTDSQYLVKGMTEWIAGWQRKGWRNSKKEPVVNRDLWEQLLALTKSHSVQWKWVRGHAGHAENERCDQLAREGIPG